MSRLLQRQDSSLQSSTFERRYTYAMRPDMLQKLYSRGYVLLATLVFAGEHLTDEQRIIYDELRKKNNQKLLRFISEQGAQAGSLVGAEHERNRELAKIILEGRSTTLIFWQNSIMLVLTLVMTVLTYWLWRLSVELASRN